jgi:2,3-diketo-5-methylthio-1-phosphopentane phosphatase
MEFAHQFIIFIDFDGTITKKDVGASVFLHFGKRPDVDEIELAIREHRISGLEGWRQLFNAAPGLTIPAIEDFSADFEIDSSLHSLISFCEQREYPVYILSDGFDNYIKIILEREGLGHIPYFSNSLAVSANNVIPVFPYPDSECNYCANCKRNHILNNSDDDSYTVYIGNGSSDTCPAQYCDFIFAKDDLLKYCERERISYFPYTTFDDVVLRMEAVSQKRKPKKRHQAQMKRNEIYKLG